GHDQAELGRVDGGVLARLVAEPAPPPDRPHQPDAPEDAERDAPAGACEKCDDEGLRQRSSECRGHECETERASLLTPGQPAPEGTGRGGEHACLADSEEEADDEEGRETPSQPPQPSPP